MAALTDARAMAEALNVTPNEAARHGLALRRDGQRRSAFDLLSYPDIGVAEIARIWPRFGELDPKIAEQLEIDAKYAVYLDRQAADVASYRRDEALALGRRSSITRPCRGFRTKSATSCRPTGREPSGRPAGSMG